MAMTRADIRQAVQDNTGRTDKDTLVNTLINLGLREIARRHLFRDLKIEDDLAIAQGEISVPLKSSTYSVEEARIIDENTSASSGVFRIYDKRDLVKLIPNPDGESEVRPSRGYVENNRMFFSAPSDGPYLLRVTVYKLPEDFIDDTQEVPITEVELTLISWVSWRLFLSIEKVESSQLWATQYEVDLLRLTSADARRPGVDRRLKGFQDEPRLLPGTYWRRWLGPGSGFSGSRW